MSEASGEATRSGEGPQPSEATRAGEVSQSGEAIHTGEVSRDRRGRPLPSPERLAAVLRERIYGGLACLSTLLVLAGHLDPGTTARTAFLDVLIGALGLWAASVLADMIAHLTAHGRIRGTDMRSALQASGQILEASAIPLLLLVLAWTGVLGLPVALQAGIWVSVLTLGLFALLAARRTGLAWWIQTLIVVALVGLGVLVTVVKLLAHA